MVHAVYCMVRRGGNSLSKHLFEENYSISGALSKVNSIFLCKKKKLIKKPYIKSRLFEVHSDTVHRIGLHLNHINVLQVKIIIFLQDSMRIEI